MNLRMTAVALSIALPAAALAQQPQSAPAQPAPAAAFTVGEGERVFDASTIKTGWLAVHVLPTLDSETSRAIVRDYLAGAPTLAGVHQIFITPDPAEAFASGLKAIAGAPTPPIYRDAGGVIASRLSIDIAGKTHALVLLEQPSGREVWRHLAASPSEHLSFAPFARRIADLTRDRAAGEANLPSDRLALAGYDPVAYLDEQKATPGDKAIESSYRGVAYHFASAAHRTAFNADPERYLPAYGGWCATAMAKGDKVEVDPKNFKITGGRLFLFYKGLFGNAINDWNKDEPGLTRKADANWVKLTAADAPTTR